MKPTIGRAVHYVSHGTPPREDATQAYTSCCRAATITQVNDDGTVGLAVLNPTGFFFHEAVMADHTEQQGGTWHWPEGSGPKAADMVVRVSLDTDPFRQQLREQLDALHREAATAAGDARSLQLPAQDFETPAQAQHEYLVTYICASNSLADKMRIRACGYGIDGDLVTFHDAAGRTVSIPRERLVSVQRLNQPAAEPHTAGVAPKPTVGSIVLYTLTCDDADAINRRRRDWQTYSAAGRQSIGYQAHVGNGVSAGQTYPAVIVRVWNDTTVNLQVLLDGNDTYWATSSVRGDSDGQWRWPERA